MIAALGPKNVALAAELAEGWQPIFYLPEKAALTWDEPLAEGQAKRADDLPPLDVIAAAPLAIGDDVTHLRDLTRPVFALYIGGMGARGKNFYHDLACRYGYEQEANLIQDAYLAGRKDEAAALVPAELVEKTALIGPHGYVEERLAALQGGRRHHPQRHRAGPHPRGPGRGHRPDPRDGRLTRQREKRKPSYRTARGFPDPRTHASLSRLRGRGCGRARPAGAAGSAATNSRPDGVSRYTWRGGRLPWPGSHDVSSRPRSASRTRIG